MVLSGAHCQVGGSSQRSWASWTTAWLQSAPSRTWELHPFPNLQKPQAPTLASAVWVYPERVGTPCFSTSLLFPNPNSWLGDLIFSNKFVIQSQSQVQEHNRWLDSIVFLLDIAFDQSNESQFSVWFKVFLKAITKEDIQKNHSVKGCITGINKLPAKGNTLKTNANLDVLDLIIIQSHLAERF